MRNPVIVMSLLAGLIFLVAVACGGGSEPAATATPQRVSPPPPPPAAKPTATAPAPTTPSQPSTQAAGTAVNVKFEDPGRGGKYQFNPSALSFKVGDTVSFTLTAGTEYHSFTVDELKIDEPVDPDVNKTFSFTFSKPGTFKLICIPHEASGMVGTITLN